MKNWKLIKNYTNYIKNRNRNRKCRMFFFFLWNKKSYDLRAWIDVRYGWRIIRLVIIRLNLKHQRNIYHLQIDGFYGLFTTRFIMLMIQTWYQMTLWTCRNVSIKLNHNSSRSALCVRHMRHLIRWICSRILYMRTEISNYYTWYIIV